MGPSVELVLTMVQTIVKHTQYAMQMLSLLIPGPTSLKNDIDVYFQPLVEELKEL